MALGWPDFDAVFLQILSPDETNDVTRLTTMLRDYLFCVTYFTELGSKETHLGYILK